MQSRRLSTLDIPKKEKRVKRFNTQDVNLLMQKLAMRTVEKDVEDAWREFFTTVFIKHRTDKNDEYVMTSPEGVDGLIKSNNIIFALKLLLEFKDGTNLDNINDRARVTAQCIHYMKLLNDNEGIKPNVICGADQEKAFVLYAPNFYDYLDKSYNWNCSPSSAYKEDPKLMRDLILDKNLAVWVYDFKADKPRQTKMNLQELVDEINKLAQQNGNEYQVKVTGSNISGMFAEFKRIVLNKPNQVTSREAVTIFMKLLIGDNKDYYLHPNFYNKLHLPSGKLIDVDGIGLKTFFKHFNRRLKPREQDRLLAMSDRLIQDETRRRKGDFWTPTIWANKADTILAETFGKDYKEDAIIWDCAAGTKNLTRDFIYEDLYTSTIFQSEIDLGEKYNPEAKESFQYDFLNDDVELNPIDNPDPNDWKMPNSLFNELKNASKTDKKVIFYTNPPYGTANNFGKYGTSKANMAKNKMNIYMKANKYGSAAQQLYAQFFVRILKIVDDFKLTNVGIGFFTKPRFFAGGSYWKKFNDKFFGKFKFCKGVMFNSGEFNDTSNTWPIVFATYTLKKNDDKDTTTFKFDLDKSDWINENDRMEVVPVLNDYPVKRMRMVYKPDDLSSWIKEPLEGKKYKRAPYSYPQLSSAMSESKGLKPRGKLLDKSLGYMVFNSDNVGEGTTNRGVWVVTSSAFKANGFNVLPENLNRAVVGFAARRAVSPTWYNDQDNYQKPDEDSNKYKELVNDSLIYTLFDNASYQAAYRNWKDYSNLTNFKTKWANQWFWLTIEEMRDLADHYSQNEVYDDTRGDSDRYIAKLLKNKVLSNEAQDVLDAANNILKITMPDRQAAIISNYSLSLNAWDAGWFQIKQLVKMFPTNENQQLMDEFKNKFAVLKSKIENEVYAMNMLIK